VCRLAAETDQKGRDWLPLSPAVAVESTRLPEPLHKDPADQIIVATARILDCPLVTYDRKIRAYRSVRLAG
jgi:PIN domain nuclease of toxin-antitoxin system